MRTPVLNRWIFALLPVAALAIGAIAYSSSNPPRSAGQSSAQIDAQGRLILPPASQAPVPRGIQKALGPLKIEPNPVAGGEVVHLKGRFTTYSVARIGKDGKLVEDCVRDPAAYFARSPEVPAGTGQGASPVR